MKAVMMLLCPVIGPTFILLAFFFYKLFSFGGVDLSDVVFSKDHTEKFLHPDEDVEKNMVSLEEALEGSAKRESKPLFLRMKSGEEIWFPSKRPWRLRIKRAFVHL